ncbi:MAG: glycosyltransferase family 4 protein [Tannerellaceae bacterium]|jgi:glycosyltransferase involved in cell wall biosynthesis|nr:glycosyltransferase family 4 protein [Tannerellaceae bacterium]
MAKILLANKFYYPRGGDCTATLSLENLLREKGHEVAVFSMQHPENLPNKYDSYFPSEVSYSSGRTNNRLKAAIRPFGEKEVKRKFTQILDDFQPEIVHLHNIHTHLSPVLAEIAYKRHIKVIWTLHDYKLLCHRSDCLRDNIPCEMCYTQKWKVMKYNCVKNSFKGSLLAYLEAVCWNRKRLERYVYKFISPSQFLKSRMVSASYDSDRIAVIPNFIRQSPLPNDRKKQDYYCYVGRISSEKGIDTLLKAAKDFRLPLYIIGGGPDFNPLKKEYESEYIHFSGFQTHDKVIEMIGNARFTVIPSIWYDNNPLSVIESLCAGTPVIGARIGGIPELIKEGNNGFLFTPGSTGELKGKIAAAIHTFDDSYPYREIAERAQQRFSADVFYEQLRKIYNIQDL